jgi:ferric-dicitrate binding protein FerR (iron transport regulator)
MKKKETDILSRFIASEYCSEEELKRLQDWLANHEHDKDLNSLLESEWNKNDYKETFVDFHEVEEKINHFESEKKDKILPVFNNFVKSYQKWAAVLLLPVILITAYIYFFHNSREPVYFTTIAERGQKSQIVLPDGSKVWLNSETELKYSANFGKQNRFVELTGEAFFEVAKDPRIPFIVSTGYTKVRVKGTSFNIKAYAAEDEIETSLIEGKIELTMYPDPSNTSQKTIEMFPGQSLIFNKVNKKLKQNNAETDENIGWKNNQLIFRNDSFDNLVKKIERWYNVEIIYDEAKLKDQRLTVELYQGERLDRLVEIIELAISVDCTIDGNKIYVKTGNKKNKG